MTGTSPIPKEVQLEITRRYDEGERASALAGAFGTNRKTITTIVRRNGGTVRDQRRASGRPSVDFTALHPRIRELREQGWSQQRIANEVGIAQCTVSRALQSMGLPTMEVRTGAAHPAWKGGRIEMPGGYVGVAPKPDDEIGRSMRNSVGYVLEHRLNMAHLLGRPLRSDETVHHINGDRTDNRISNLQLRQGRHGSGVVMCCQDCGSHNIATVAITTPGQMVAVLRPVKPKPKG